MINNYFKIALRSLRSNILFSGLNITGLAIGLSAGIIVILWMADEFSYNKFIPNVRNIHMILQNQTQGGEMYTFVSTPGPLAAALREEIPEMEAVCRTSWGGEELFNYGEKAVYERRLYAEADFFKIFKLPVLKGDPIAALNNVNSVVITARTARKFFGDEEPIGKILQHSNQRSLKVGAVIRDIPETSTLHFDMLLPFQIYEQNNKELIATWGNNSLPTYALLQPGANIASLNTKLENFIQGKEPDAAAHIFAYPLTEWRLHGKFENGKPSGGRIDFLMMMGLIGVFVLLIACVNFMNLATARSEKRAREVGVRKAMGAQRGGLIAQFMSESLLVSFLALGLALLLAQMALPAFNRIFNKAITFASAGAWVWAGVLALGLITGILAGSYPAFFLSKFQAVKVLKGGVIINGKGTNMLRRGLVTFQFVISIYLIISTIVIYQQIKFAENKPIGYEPSNLIEIAVQGDMGKKYDALKNDILQIPGVKSVTAANCNMVNLGSNTSGITWPGQTDDQDFLITIMQVGYDWTQTVGLKLAEGRDFSREYGNDKMACILNRTAVKRMGLKEPVVGTVITYDTTMTIIGVVEDFDYNNPFEKPDPLVVSLGEDNMRSFFLRLENKQNWTHDLAQVESVFKIHNPSFPFEPRFTNDVYQQKFEGMRSGGKMAQLFGGLAIFISCLGLFGLSAFTAERRRKEIGVRKVLGASAQNVLLQLSKDFLKPVILAFVLAAPLAFWAMQTLLDSLDYRINMEWWMFAIALMLVTLVAALTVGFQSMRAAFANPVDALRCE